MVNLLSNIRLDQTSSGTCLFGNDQEPASRNRELTGQDSSVLDLLYEVGKKVGSTPNLDKLVQDITQMTQNTLDASASSVLILHDDGEELSFKFASGSAENLLKNIKLDIKSGIVGWVASHGKPLMINNVRDDPRFNSHIDEKTGFITTNVLCVPLIVQQKIIGVIEVLNKKNGGNFTSRDIETLTSVASTAAISIENIILQQSVIDAYKSTIKALAATIDAKDHYTSGHSQRVTEYAIKAAKALSLPPEEMEVLEYAGLLHDIGKIGIEDNILNKPGKLDDREWSIMRTHPLIGFNMVKEIPFLNKVSELILYHHENVDGTGYPERLKNEEIPSGARILAVADAFDTITTDRAYRASLGIDYALKELERCSGTQFCPVSAAALASIYQPQIQHFF